MAVTVYLQQKITPTTQSNEQMKVMSGEDPLEVYRKAMSNIAPVVSEVTILLFVNWDILGLYVKLVIFMVNLEWLIQIYNFINVHSVIYKLIDC